MLGQQGAFQSELTGSAQVQPFSVGAGRGKLQQPCAARSSKPQGVDQGVDVKTQQFADGGSRPKRTLRARIVKTPDGFQANCRVGNTGGQFKAKRQGSEEGSPRQTFPLAHSQGGRQHRAAGVGAGERLAFKGADEHTIAQSCTGYIRLPGLVYDRGFGDATQEPQHSQSPL